MAAILALVLLLAWFGVGVADVDVDVVIVGAGWAGMAAADSLARSNVSFVVLEATNRTGGRTHAITFGDPKVWRGVVERGANWVSGVAPPGVEKGGAAGVAAGLEKLPWQNPVYRLAKQERLRTVRVPGSADGNISGYNAVFRSNGDVNGDPGGAIRARANAALGCVNSSWARKVNKADTMREGLRHCGWVPSTEEEFAVDWAMSGEDANGEPARNESLRSFDPDDSYRWWGPDDRFVVDQHPRGFARLIDGMVQDSVPPGDPRVVFNATVIKLQYGVGGVDVTTQDGRRFHARHEVFSTLPLGVLQRDHVRLFDPPLPADQARLLSPSSRFVMGNLTHVVVQFGSVFWDNSLQKWLQANKGSNRSAAGGPDGAGPNAAGEFAVWHNLNHATMLPGSRTLLSFLGEPQSTRYEAMDDASARAAVVQRIRATHPGIAVPEPSAFFMSRHGLDPHSWGAYSISLAGWNSTLHATLARPVRDARNATRVRLLGEAMCFELNGYTHAAYQTGREGAARYLYEQGLGPDPTLSAALSLCNCAL